MVMYIILGTILDQVAILLITLPLVYPLIINLGYDPIWFGIIAIKLGEVGLVTPPIGMNAYVVNATTNIALEVIFRGVAMLLVFEAVSIVLLLAFPALSLWLPSKMF
jgi:TRAP-type C4-dicarboxylate transport system permease large subunit